MIRYIIDNMNSRANDALNFGMPTWSFFFDKDTTGTFSGVAMAE